MSEEKFTPGPWKWAPSSCCGWELLAPSGRVHIDGADCHECGVDIDAHGPDARLIAAAPDLYAALKEIDDSWTAEGWRPENAKWLTRFTDDTIERWKNMRAALAKARGEAR